MRKTIFYNVSLLLLPLFLSIVFRKQIRGKQFFTNFYHFSSHQFFSVSKHEQNNRPSFLRFSIFSSFPSLKKGFLKTRFTDSMKGEINPSVEGRRRAIDGRQISTGRQRERDNDRGRVVKLD